MRKQTESFLTENQSPTPSQWREEAEWRRKNNAWLRYSQQIALTILDYMKREHLTQSEMAQRMGCSQQYVSKIIKGSENLTIETISKIESVTGCKIISFAC